MDVLSNSIDVLDAKAIMDAVPTIEVPLPMYEMLLRATERVAALDDYMKNCESRKYMTIDKGIVCAILGLEMPEKEEQ